MKKIKDSFLSHIWLKILSLIMAAVIWFVVMNVEDSKIIRTIQNVPVEMLNEETILESGGVYDVTEGETVDVLVNGPRSVVENMEASDIRATADLSHLSVTNSTTISLEPAGTISARKASLLTLTPVDEYVTLSIEEETEKSIPIKVITTGNVKTGYALGNPAPTPNMITVKGPDSVLSNIVEARAVVDVTNAESDIAEKVKIGCIDGYGTAIEKDNVTLSAEEATVTIPVYKTKTIPVYVNVTGTPKDGYGVRDINFEPSTIIISGENEKLAEIKSVEISDVNVADASEVIEKNVDISEYLPQDVFLADSTTEIAVSVNIERVSTKEFSLNSSAIKIVGTNSKYNYSIMKPQVVKVKLNGFQDDLSSMLITELNPRIKATDLKPGEHEIQVVFDNSDVYSLVGDYYVTLSVEEKE